ncbi:uncharacterized protein LOC114364294 [Ostrinia furnacalis]|uniref:uncharacterized protein LOC114364294 n=1 Tax=Ostrinia furnacalis TaxID=93504 RepID=UPI00103F8FD0|nr:uncharacterized protein LOC114364294 [Ostrinia furnacalis]
MKTVSEKSSTRKNGYQSDDDNVRYKINTVYFNKLNKSPNTQKKQEKVLNDDNDVRYKFPTVLHNKPKVEQKPKPKPKIKVNFWSNKQTGSRLHNVEANKEKVNRRHTVAAVSEEATLSKPKNSGVKVKKRVSFLPSPLFSDNHVPMVTVPDDLTIHLNEEEANDLGEDLNSAFVNSNNTDDEVSKRKNKISTIQTSPKGKRKRSSDDYDARGQGNENELEFFSKYVVQKLRRMETNQRIYSENLINTVLMLGQLGKLNVKSKIAEA